MANLINCWVEVLQTKPPKYQLYNWTKSILNYLCKIHLFKILHFPQSMHFTHRTHLVFDFSRLTQLLRSCGDAIIYQWIALNESHTPIQTIVVLSLSVNYFTQQNRTIIVDKHTMSVIIGSTTSFDFTTSFNLLDLLLWHLLRL